MDLLASMKPREGEVLHLILDDIRIGKRGKTMAWVSKLWDHTLPTMQQRLQILRDEVARDQIRRLVKGPKHAKLRQSLYEHLLAA